MMTSVRGGVNRAATLRYLLATPELLLQSLVRGGWNVVLARIGSGRIVSRLLRLRRRQDDLDLARVDRGRLVEEGSDQAGPRDHDCDHDQLQRHPGDGAPVD